MNRRTQLVAVLLAFVLVSGCTAARAYRQAEDLGMRGEWDAAVSYYRRALEVEPDRPEYRIALERAMTQASRAHLDLARELEQRDDLQAAIVEYRKAAEYDGSNQLAAQRANQLEIAVRDRIEAARPKPKVEEMRERASQSTQPPLLNPASREPIDLRFTNASTQDILNFIANATGINIIYDRDFRPTPFSIQLEGVALEEALNQIVTTNQLWFKVLNERTILIIPDTVQKRQQLEEQVVRTFYISHVDPQEVAQMLTQVLRFTGGVAPFVSPNKNTNTITVRGTAPVVAIFERIIQGIDKPRAEIVVDVEILEVNRSRAKEYGLNLSSYSLGTVFSPESRPGTDSGAGGGGTTTSLFNLNTISQGISTADFYLAVPQAVVRFLESDSQTKLIAKPQLRGAEGTKLTLDLGDEIPVPSTTFTALAVGGAASSPLTSFQYRTVGIRVEMTPRVTFENEIVLDVLVENSSLGQSINIAGQALPTFGTRKVQTRLRLREGESNLLAGLLREDDRRQLRGFPGLLRLPILKQLLSDNEETVGQTDIVMLMTPRIVRTHSLTQQNLDPIFIGTQQNVGLGGPAPLIAAPAPPPGAAVVADPSAQPRFGPTAPTPGMTMPIPPAAAPPAPQPDVPATAPDANVAPPGQPSPGAGAPPSAGPTAQVTISPPGSEFRVGGGPYTVPISISGASRVSVLSISVSFNPALVRVQSVQEGSFMRQGASNVTFTQQVDAGTGRVDITIMRTGDATGASGAGLLAALLLTPVAPGSLSLSVNGVGSAPDSAPLPLQFAPVTIAIK